MLGQAAIGGDLAAEHREQRRDAVWRIDLEMIVARDRGGIVVAVVEQGRTPEYVHTTSAGATGLAM